MILHIFTREGWTFTFHGVKDLFTNERVIKFKYRASSDDFDKTGTFYVKNIAGYSTT